MFIYQNYFFVIKFFVLKLYVKGVNYWYLFLLTINVSREIFTNMFKSKFCYEEVKVICFT